MSVPSLETTDLEMTKLCAEALRGDDKSITITVADGHVWNQWDDGSWAQNSQKFDPLHDDTQTMALVKTFFLSIGWDGQFWIVSADSTSWLPRRDLNRAIVECVSKLQQAK